MKRNIIVFFSVWSLVSCNNNATESRPVEDSTAIAPHDDTALVRPGDFDMSAMLEFTTPAFIRQQYSYEELYGELQLRQSRKWQEVPGQDTLPPFLLKRRGLRRLTEKQLIITIDQIQREKLKIYGNYGDDNREDPYTMSPDMRQLAGKVGLIIDTVHLVKTTDGNYTLHDRGIMKSALGTCEGEHFNRQPVVQAQGTGFAICKTVMVTASHCLDNSNYKRFCIVFGYRMKDSLNANLLIKAEDVYRVESVVTYNAAQDYCVFKTDRPLSPEKVLLVSRRVPEVLDQVYSIGYGLGLPVKVASKAFVRSSFSVGGFICNLDVYTGDSGAPVFWKDSVIGILTGGIRDFRFKTKEQCRIAFRCEDWDCEGETVTSAFGFMDVCDRLNR
ncbi:trypsin-like peptidase domain-containing protein [Chitinophaga sp. G-6-1-13]|uniref:Trypsin-like peptidase domain-containing protein n=1 Tax=Chitinophaga fulva TaxID=2728842 RepID=A0A848GMX4_9BACT|nr:serine protease [Chitinophaga fulva]NML39965.1 trypsin-like peptidase domain-containing protein [Chitinophaga fulva]